MDLIEIKKKKKKKGKEEIPRNSKIENNWFLIIKLVDIIRSFIRPKKKTKANENLQIWGPLSIIWL
jgi:7,8-dihydro-6-hydroxymethylpterin-pyrophosphokinase